MNEALLCQLLGTTEDALSSEGLHAVASRISRSGHAKQVRALAKSTSESKRAHAIAIVLRETLQSVPELGDRTRAHLVARAQALAGSAAGEHELASLTVAVLKSWPTVPDEVLSRLEHEAPGASAATLNHETNGSETEEIKMTVELQIDVRGLPPALQSKEAQQAYVESVKTNLTTAMGGTEPPAEAIAYSVGKLLRTGQFTGTSASFFTFVKTTWDQLTSQYKARTGMVSGMAVVQRIVKLLGGKTNGTSTSASTNGSGGGKSWTAQQLAFIFDQTLETLQTIAPEDSGFSTRVDRAYLDYASGDIGYDGFQLPELDATTDGDLLPQNMMAAGRLYGCFEFERLRLIPVVDRVAELWRAGVVPIGNDSGGQLLNDYFWARDQRLTEGARGLIFGRLFGVSGMETSKDSQPNKGFEALLRRFLTNVAQLRRLQDQQVVISNPGESKTLMSENVRKTGRELATNLSLYGWGSAYFDASRIDSHIALAYKIVDDAQVQQAFAATTPWQVVERVSQQEFGVTPNIVKHHTMAMAGRRIIEILAQNPSALTSRLGEFQDLLGVDTWNELSRLALGWLSVNGVTSEQLVSYSAPVDAIASPSVPTMPAQPGASPNMSRLRDMVSSGQMPSLDQLQRMFN